jgi:uridine kinase
MRESRVPAAGMTARDQAIGAIADCIESCAVPHPLRVAVDGRTASGKTTLANELATVLRSRSCPVIRTSVDGFHRPRTHRYRRGRHSPEGYLDDARDWEAVRRLLLDPLGPWGDRLYRTASFDLDRDEPVDQPVVRAEPGAIAIVDGSFLQRIELAEAWDLVIFVEVSAAMAVSRGAARDAALLGGGAAAREMHERRYQPAFAIYDARCRPREGAHLVVENEEPSAPRIVRTQRPGCQFPSP